MANNKTDLKKLLKPLLQLLVTALALYLVFKKTDIAKLTNIIRGANPWYLLLSLFFFNLSKLFNAIRLNRFFKAIGIELSPMYNLKLYYLGMFYNLFLPGGIGGDGYKIYVLQKNHGLKMINVFHAVLWDRICGIFALVFLSIILLLHSSFALKFPHLIPYTWVLLGMIYPTSLLLNKLFYKQFIGVFTITAIESMLVQITQVISVCFILKAISQNANMIDYLAIFLISSIATIIPITIGGAGAREITFFYLLGTIQLETSTGIALSLIFFALSALSSLIGILTRIDHEKKLPNNSTTP
ncbi:MAG: lysylphosphatidylglycerol synthase transmembrane domain-containing protein [Chlorobiales bacterium]|nr:lysylphosphatidylglycerol synthase transmembrane domain-containing protein [Chlorobiales bacterium]